MLRIGDDAIVGNLHASTITFDDGTISTTASPVKVNFTSQLTSNNTVPSAAYKYFNMDDFTTSSTGKVLSNPSNVFTFTAPRDGVYYIGVTIDFDGNGDGQFVAGIQIQKNGINSLRSYSHLGSDEDAQNTTSSCSNVFVLNSGDEITVLGVFYHRNGLTGQWLSSGTVFYGFNID